MIKIILICLLLVCVMLMLYFIFRKREELFYTTKDYLELKIIEDNWKTIAKEIPEISLDKLDQYKKNKRSRTAWNNEEANKLATDMKSEWILGWQTDSWYNFPLMYHNNVIDKADIFCPKTIEILKKIPSIQIAGYSLLLPNSKLDKHVDETGKRNGSMACNLLLTDNNASLYILDNEKKHDLGKAIIFDSNIEHYADNKDAKVRIILYIDFKTDTIFGTRQKGLGLGSALGYPTVNIKLDREIKCGIYKGDSEHGEVIIIVFKNGYAECHYKSKEYNSNEDRIYIYNIKPIEGEKGSIIDIYNKGCI